LGTPRIGNEPKVRVRTCFDSDAVPDTHARFVSDDGHRTAALQHGVLECLFSARLLGKLLAGDSAGRGAQCPVAA
jgi:hypothetical protein